MCVADALASHMDNDLSALSKLDRIANEVCEHLTQTSLVPTKRSWYVTVEEQAQLDMFFLRASA